MTMNLPGDFELELHAHLEQLVRRRGPCEVDWLVAHARRTLRKPVDEQAVLVGIDGSTLLVGLPDGRVDHLIRTFDGAVFTQRVRADLSGRTDLWATCALQPLLSILTFTSLDHVGGGQITASAFGHDAIVGPPGWLPPARPYELVAVRLSAGAVEAAAIGESDLPDLDTQQAARELIAFHYKRERWWLGEDDLATRPAELVRALAYARLEDPTLLATPLPPLDELLHDPLEQALDQHHWREFAATRQAECVSFYLHGLPEPLYAELNGRADVYGMTLDQYVITALGHLAWRTPFAEDLNAWDDWDLDRAAASVSELKST